MKYVVTTESTSLNVRAAPHPSASILRVIEKGEIVSVSDTSANGVWRELTTGGWVSSRYLTPLGPQTTPPVPLPTNGLPSFTSMWANYPDDHDSNKVKRAIGGKVDADWIDNTCTIRLSRAFNYSGHPIPRNFPGLNVVSGGDGMWYAFRVREMRRYLESRYGKPSFQASGPEASLHANGKPGIIMFDVAGWTSATGHFDIWNGHEARYGSFFTQAREVLIWG